MLKHAVVQLVNYQDDADLATKALPELINLLNEDCDQMVLQNAILMIYQLSRKDASRHAIVQSPQLVASVIRTVMEHEQNHELVKTAAHLLYNLSQHRQGLLAIFKSGGINCLVKLLGSLVEIVVFYAISTLHNLLVHQEGSKMVVRLSGGLQKMVSLLSRNNYKLLTYVTDCLHLMVYGNQEGKLILLASGAPQELCRIMKTYTSEKLLLTTSRVLMVLSVCTSNKPAIIQSGGVQALAVHLKNSSERLVQSCLYTLRNLSDDASILNENLEQLITSLVELVNSEKPNIVLCVTGILSNTSSNNQHAKQLICQVNLIPSLINILIKFPDRDDILEPTICTLRHLSIRQAEAEFATNAIRINNGIPILVKLLNSNIRWFLQKVVVGLLRNLAFNVTNHQQFREQQAIPKLIGLLIKAHNEVKRHKTNETNTLNANGALIGAQLTSPVYIDGVSMDGIIEATVGTLQLLAKQAINRDLIRPNNELIQILVELLYNEQEAVQRVAVATLCELSTEKEGAEKIEQEGATIPLTNLLNSRNESISSYSAAILYILSDGKSNDYKKQLTSELSSSLYRDDLNLSNLNAANNNAWQMTLNSTAANDLDINLLYPQFATLNNSLTQTSINPTLYQDVYNTQVGKFDLNNLIKKFIYLFLKKLGIIWSNYKCISVRCIIKCK